MKIGGRIQMDGAFFNDKVTPMGDGLFLRRARLNVSGKVFKNWGYFTSVDFAKKDKAGVRGMYFSYKGWENYTLKLGQFQEPFSLEGMNSSNTITFMERGLPYVFAPDYHLGEVSPAMDNGGKPLPGFSPMRFKPKRIISIMVGGLLGG